MINPVYNKIGVGYNVTRKADTYIAKRIRQLLDPQQGKAYLDIGCGTGNYTKELAQEGYRFWGVDPSITMLKQSEYNENLITWINGSAESFSLPLDVKLDGCIAINTMHHWDSMEEGLKNISTKLEVGSRMVIFTQLIEQINSYWLKHYFPIMIEKSLINRPTEYSLSVLLENAGLKFCLCERYFTNDDLEDIFINAGKNNPSIYLQESVRRGMSNFQLFCSQEEESDGLDRLSKDIKSGKIAEIIKSYDSDLGDYSFIQAIKK